MASAPVKPAPQPEMAPAKPAPQPVMASAPAKPAPQPVMASAPAKPAPQPVMASAPAKPAPQPVAAFSVPATQATPTPVALVGLRQSLEQFHAHQTETAQSHQQYLQHQADYAQNFLQLTQQLDQFVGQPRPKPATNLQPALETLGQSVRQFQSYQTETVQSHEQYLHHQGQYAEAFLNLIQQQYGRLPSTSSGGSRPDGQTTERSFGSVSDTDPPTGYYSPTGYY